MADSGNPMRRTLLGASPVFIPAFVNLGIILIAGIFYIYNSQQQLTTDQVAKMVAESGLKKS
jgi:hypothetical protein